MTAAKKVKIKMLRDGVFPFADVRKDKGDVVEVAAEAAKDMIANGLAAKA